MRDHSSRRQRRRRRKKLRGRMRHKRAYRSSRQRGAYAGLHLPAFTRYHPKQAPE